MHELANRQMNPLCCFPYSLRYGDIPSVPTVTPARQHVEPTVKDIVDAERSSSQCLRQSATCWHRADVGRLQCTLPPGPGSDGNESRSVCSRAAANDLTNARVDGSQSACKTTPVCLKVSRDASLHSSWMRDHVASNQHWHLKCNIIVRSEERPVPHHVRSAVLGHDK